MDLKNHDPLTQTVPYAMHTVKVVAEHLFMLIIGKEVRQAEMKLGRFDCEAPIAPTRKQRRNALPTLLEVVCYGSTLLVCLDYCLSFTHVYVLLSTLLHMCCHSTLKCVSRHACTSRVMHDWFS